MLDAHLLDLPDSDVRAELAAFGPDLTVVTTAPSYLFWRCAPPELRVPQALVRAIDGRGRPDRRHRPARLDHARAPPCASSASPPW